MECVKIGLFPLQALSKPAGVPVSLLGAKAEATEKVCEI
jgi:hypothetical protein